jgi:adenine deaminase
VASGEILAELPCPLGGLLSDRAAEEVAAGAEAVDRAATELGVSMGSPFMAMSFLALSVIPELKITDRGLVDTVRFELVPLQA